MPNRLFDRKNAVSGAISVAILLSLGGCESDPQGYAHTIVDRPAPATDDQRARECNFLKSEIARQQAMTEVGTDTGMLPDAMAAIQTAAKNNIAALQSRAAADGCPQ